MDTMSDHAQQAQVLLLGTFHFQDAGLDWYKPQHDVAIQSEQRQSKLRDVLGRLARFAPTKIAIERRPDVQPALDAEYQAFCAAPGELPPGEVYQLGFRLGHRLGHERLYCIDAWGRYDDPPLDLEPLGVGRTTRELSALLDEHYQFEPMTPLRAFTRAHGQEDAIAAWERALQEDAAHGDTAKTQRTLRESLILAHTEDAILRSHGVYLTSWFRVGAEHDYPGVDWVTAWYNRNLRIFANLQRITESPDDRILVIYGSGLIPILRHCVMASSDYRLVETQTYLA